MAQANPTVRELVGRSRRQVLAGAAALVVPRRVLGGRGHVAPSDRLVIAGVGVGGVGRSYLKGCESQSIAVLCDVDLAYAAKTFAAYPGAVRYQDYRVMLDKEKGIDAVDDRQAAVAEADARLRVLPDAAVVGSSVADALRHRPEDRGPGRGIAGMAPVNEAAEAAHRSSPGGPRHLARLSSPRRSRRVW